MENNTPERKENNEKCRFLILSLTDTIKDYIKTTSLDVARINITMKGFYDDGEMIAFTFDVKSPNGDNK